MWNPNLLSLRYSKLEHRLSHFRRLHRPPLLPRHPWSCSSVQINIAVPVDPLEWQISQETANGIAAWMANTIGAAESVLRVAATGHDKRLFLKVVVFLYLLSALGRSASGATIAYGALCLVCLFVVTQNSQQVNTCSSQFLRRRDSTSALLQDPL
ncbi:reticulon-like protein B22 [Amborella trichopoda]|uniref:reticulon-like protein B22 n=1 Tax=Amborella trichopoda TaxID=13333 RepID=UPI0005D3672F|nr:reticulon-like protein B22 [Amborella trichopoda]|eukprot:XP_011625759.1 reticulon-like protein B22 [Amborella trichopoda]